MTLSAAAHQLSSSDTHSSERKQGADTFASKRTLLVLLNKKRRTTEISVTFLNKYILDYLLKLGQSFIWHPNLCCHTIDWDIKKKLNWNYSWNKYKEEEKGLIKNVSLSQKICLKLIDRRIQNTRTINALKVKRKKKNYQF